MSIGVFDSGVGGLTVHRALVQRLPQADFVYLADQANAPYGGRPGEEIVDLTRAGCERLFATGASLVVLACNTASAIALRRLQQTWLPGYRKSSSWTFWGCSRPRARPIRASTRSRSTSASRTSRCSRNLARTWCR
jgi:glutamate racemase